MFCQFRKVLTILARVCVHCTRSSDTYLHVVETLKTKTNHFLLLKHTNVFLIIIVLPNILQCHMVGSFKVGGLKNPHENRCQSKLHFFNNLSLGFFFHVCVC